MNNLEESCCCISFKMGVTPCICGCHRETISKQLVKDEIEKELNRWNGGGEYYYNVSKALENLKNNLKL